MDVAAGQLMIEEAGGVYSRYGDYSSFNSPVNILASNPFLHPSLQQTLVS